MKFYLASRLSNQDSLLKRRKQIINKGHEVISRWLDIDRSGYLKDFRGSQEWYKLSKIRYKEDFEDIDSSDAIVLWPNENIKERKPNGGMYVEFGYAIAKNKLLHIIEPTNFNIFLYHGTNLTRYENWEQFLEWL